MFKNYEDIKEARERGSRPTREEYDDAHLGQQEELTAVACDLGHALAQKRAFPDSYAAQLALDEARGAFARELDRLADLCVWQGEDHPPPKPFGPTY